MQTRVEMELELELYEKKAPLLGYSQQEEPPPRFTNWVVDRSCYRATDSTHNRFDFEDSYLV
ncbi:hypothetical protein F8388_013117 [Cannabis sativa]|uniref:Uncharacterized protein n=1 Tax=Cannabis sativa TaxID=3483 RepID=A0A7J6HMS0_CANSA|nr:hypothetical protein F8388_013117 [Cannabis sativa]